jgi:CDP-paratose 2-epimerase
MLEAIASVEALTGRKLDWRYVDEACRGDHMCYISNLSKFKSHYPKWKLTRSLSMILEEMVESQKAQRAQSAK